MVAMVLLRMFRPFHWLLTVSMSGAALISAPAVQSPPTVAEALDLYKSGRSAETFRRLRDSRGVFSLGTWLADPSSRSQPIERLILQANRWAKSGDQTEAAGRRLTTAAFALDVVWAERQAMGDDLMGHLAWSDDLITIVAFGCPLSRASSRSAAERWWYLASVAMLEDAEEWEVLRGHSVPPFGIAQMSGVNAEYSQGHFSHARSQIPEEPRWRLVAMVLAENNYRRQLQIERVRLHQGGGSGPRGDESPYDVVARLGPGGSSSAPPGLTAARGALDQEIGTLMLDPDPAVRAEAVLHLGYWRMSEHDWEGAIRELKALSSPDVDPYLRYMAAYFRGWANQRLGHRADAIADYRQADRIVPNGRIVSTLLASQLFIGGRGSEAYDALEAGLNESHTVSPDPATLFSRGDSRFIKDYLFEMREALR